MNVVIFTGGNGNSNLIRFIEHLSYANLSLIINGYDDGLSTGTIRAANNGMLGPSDFRKNFTYILDNFSTSNLYIKQLFNYRLSVHDCNTLLNDPKLFIEQIMGIDKFKPHSEEFLRSYLSMGIDVLLSYTKEIEQLNDFSLGNIIIGGLYNHFNDFNRALKELTEFFDLNARMINASTDDDAKLVAFDKKLNLLSNEAAIVNYQGDEPIKDFYLLPFSRIREIEKKNILAPDEIESMAITPQISKEAKEAISDADLILFGSGTLFSSLLPSYRICSDAILRSNARKVLIINNEYDNDIRNIELDEYVQLILREFPGRDISFFDRIIVDSRSAIIKSDKTISNYSNLILEDVSNHDRKHNGFKLWGAITKSLVQTGGLHRIKIIPSDEMSEKTKMIYHEEIEEYNKNAIGDIEFYLDHEKSIDYNYYLIIDTSGKINLNDIKNWVEFAIKFDFDCIFGSRFYSRRQMIFSYKRRLVESKRVYLFSLFTSNLVSFFYFLRFFKIVSDPFSGIYLIKADNGFRYKGVPHFLKYINKNKIEILSLPITYRTFKQVNYMRKSVSVLKNIIKLFFK